MFLMIIWWFQSLDLVVQQIKIRSKPVKCSSQTSKILTRIGNVFMNDHSPCKRRYTDSVLYWLSRESFGGNCTQSWEFWRELRIIGRLIADNPRADSTKRRARVLIPPGYLHPGKRKHYRSLKFINDRGRGSPTVLECCGCVVIWVILTDLKNMADCHE
jgi:hypothetical protein